MFFLTKCRFSLLSLLFLILLLLFCSCSVVGRWNLIEQQYEERINLNGDLPADSRAGLETTPPAAATGASSSSPSPAPTPVPTPTPAPGATFVIYDDTLQNGFESKSWFCSLDYSATNYIYEGNPAMRVSYTGDYSTMRLYCTPGDVNATNFAHIRLYINGGTASNQNLTLWILNSIQVQCGSVVEMNSYLAAGFVQANTRQAADIPLTVFNSPVLFIKIWLQHYDLGQTPEIYVDKIELY